MSYEKQIQKLKEKLQCSDRQFEALQDYGYVDHFGMFGCEDADKFKRWLNEAIMEVGEDMHEPADLRVLCNYMYS